MIATAATIQVLPGMLTISSLTAEVLLLNKP